ncbi:hypothetical protein E2C01_069049 [Portunus trituberculatus]|uniref:Uncharacterized protein n=1 Tax=Portunus trituberculatus TaxID=210409 RepID=A0A5B7HZK2_PORTR|nr:hypothetical protein [Portunus trituberculatus]
MLECRSMNRVDKTEGREMALLGPEHRIYGDSMAVRTKTIKYLVEIFGNLIPVSSPDIPSATPQPRHAEVIDAFALQDNFLCSDTTGIPYAASPLTTRAAQEAPPTRFPLFCLLRSPTSPTTHIH